MLSKVSMSQKNGFLKKHVPVLLALFALIACEQSRSPNDRNLVNTPAVIAGQLAVQGPLVHKVVGIMDSEFSPYCSGVLISKKLVLTAAHCVLMKENLWVYFGADSNSAIKVFVEQIESMDGFLKPASAGKGELVHYDLALLKLSKPAPSAYKPVVLNTDDDDLSLTLDYIPAGYGLNKLEYRKISDRLVLEIKHLNQLLSSGEKDSRDLTNRQKELLNKTISCEQSSSGQYSLCHEVISGGAGILRTGKSGFRKIENFLEFSTKARRSLSACNGDSGGPLFLEKDGHYKVMGILSRGIDEVNCYEGNIYTNVASKKARDWIKATALKFKKQ